MAHIPLPPPQQSQTRQLHHPQRWVIVHGVHRTLQRFAQSWARLPQGAAQAFLRTLVFGWLLSAAVMLVLVWLGRAYLGDETTLLLRVVQASPVSFHAAIWAETPGNSVFLVPVVLGAAILAIWRNAPLRALAIVAAFGVIDTLVLVGWLIWDRPRPDVIAGGIAAPGFHAFPSGHVAQTITVYGLFTFWWVTASRRRSEQAVATILFLLLVVAVGLSRLSLGAHWPTDLVAGAVIGGVWLLVIIRALQKAEACFTRVEAADLPSEDFVQV